MSSLFPPLARSDHPASGQSAVVSRTPSQMQQVQQMHLKQKQSEQKQSEQPEADRRTRVTVFVALAANLVIAAAKAVGGVVAGSPALLSEAAHSVADSLNEVFLLAALRRSRRPPDARHPFGYGKERFFWALLAAVGIFVGAAASPSSRGSRRCATARTRSSAAMWRA